MKKYFRIHTYHTDQECTVLLKIDESQVPENYEDDDIISLAIELEKLDEEYAEVVDSIEEISKDEYLEESQSLTFRWENKIINRG